ncbi:hypothetical protein N3K66_007251 [Trichothecium roseum]|uniref:Uncharacterized protein n=1 Tax=Trichothecium roseum TaxID=47278 RepID=A0ACC0UTE0_9HYPO|nr:hypothetical protein N3K66_007251 [Trichothecium roseum]
MEGYEILRDLGRCNAGRVVLARDKTPASASASASSLRAIKILRKAWLVENDEVARARGEREAFRATKMVVTGEEEEEERGHPFLVALRACFQTGTSLCFVMEYAGGEDLLTRLRRKPFGLEETRFYAAETCSGLSFLHDKGVLYRNLKLDNVVVSADGHVKLINYFFCKGGMGSGSTTGTFCGTQEFMAPEMLLDQEYGRGVDWWAFGVALYQMLFRASPFRGETEDDIYDAILAGDVRYPIPPTTSTDDDAVSADVSAEGGEAMVKALLAREPGQRLGCGLAGAGEVMGHPFFRSVDWDDVRRKRVTPPFTLAEANTEAGFKASGATPPLDNEAIEALPPASDAVTEEVQREFDWFSDTSSAEKTDS